MKVDGSYDVHSRRNPWPSVAADPDVGADPLTERAAVLARIVPEVFGEAAADPAVRAVGSDLPDRIVDLVADRGARCLALLE